MFSGVLLYKASLYLNKLEKQYDLTQNDDDDFVQVQEQQYDTLATGSPTSSTDIPSMT